MLLYSRYGKRSTRHRLKLRSTKKAGLIVLYATTAVLILLKIATWLNAEEIFTLNDILVEGNKLVAETDIQELIQPATANNLFNYDLRALAARVEEHPYVRTASVSRRLPDNLVVRITEEEPVAILSDDELQIISTTGKCLPLAGAFQILDYPVITGIDLNSPAGKAALKQIKDYLVDCKYNHFMLYSLISEISYSEKLGIYFNLTEEAIPVILGHDFDNSKNEYLVQVMTILKTQNELSGVKAFDLRYRDQVVVKTKLG